MRTYAPDGTALRAFMGDREHPVKIIQGPVGSGKSLACCMHVYQQALSQPKQADGKRRFRALVIRESYPRLEETTLKTWLEWFPEDQFGKFYRSKPYLHEIRVGDLELDVTFAAVQDIEEARAFFKSLEPSLIWFNEGQFQPIETIREALERVMPPRYPRVIDGGCAWGGMIIDTNAPPADHWIPIMRGDVPAPDWMTEEQRAALVKPESWAFYTQPAGLIEEVDEGKVVGYRANPKAENLRFLHQPGVDPLGPRNFYMLKLGGQTKSWIDANVMNRSAVVVNGQPVYPQFRRDAHVAQQPLDPIEGVTVQVGLDFGRQPAALIGQNLRTDWFIQREYIGRHMSATEFAPLLKSYLSQEYPGFAFVFWGDPSGGYAGQASDDTPFKVFAAHGMRVRPAPGDNKDSLRKEAMNAALMRRSASGRHSAVLVDPVRCPTFVTGMMGGYHVRRLRVSGEAYADEPVKNMYSHVCEAGEYLMLGGGEGRGAVLSGSGPVKPQNVRRPYRPFARGTRR